MKVSTYAKSIIGALAAAAIVAKAVVTDGEVTPAEGVEIVLAVLAAFGIYQVPNAPAERA
jgi:hypothetical protein